MESPMLVYSTQCFRVDVVFILGTGRLLMAPALQSLFPINLLNLFDQLIAESPFVCMLFCYPFLTGYAAY